MFLVKFVIFFTIFVFCRGETFQDMLLQDELEISEKISSINVNITENITDGVSILVYTRKNPVKYQQVQLDKVIYLRDTHFNRKRPIKILVHGWKCSNSSAYNILIKDAYLIEHNLNVIVVDWYKYSKQSYTSARSVVPKIGTIVARFVDNLCKEFNLNPDDIHIIGHSLGAHVAGIAGLKVTVGKIGRITGLDPAGPLFSLDDEQRIGIKSAKFVDIIHTAGRFAGFYSNLGHVDFYPNGGTPIQPGCGADVLTLRSHRRAYWLFAESITSPRGFSAVSCNNWARFKKKSCDNKNVTHMGEHVSRNATGSYYLRTNRKSPFALEYVNNSLPNVSDIFHMY